MLKILSKTVISDKEKLRAIGLASAAAMSVFYRVKFLTFSLYVYTTISMVSPAVISHKYFPDFMRWYH